MFPLFVMTNHRQQTKTDFSSQLQYAVLIPCVHNDITINNGAFWTDSQHTTPAGGISSLQKRQTLLVNYNRNYHFNSENKKQENRKHCLQQEKSPFVHFESRKIWSQHGVTISTQKMLLAARVIISTQKRENVACNKSYNFHSEKRKCCLQQEL